MLIDFKNSKHNDDDVEVMLEQNPVWPTSLFAERLNSDQQVITGRIRKMLVFRYSNSIQDACHMKQSNKCCSKQN